jgi:glycine dehydrogenase subunit 1
MRYIPQTEKDRRELLSAIGLKDISELFKSLPPEVLLKTPLDIPPALPEDELASYFARLASMNSGGTLMNLIGAGAYDHYIPAAVDQLISRSEFYTAYTPYQPEISQGTLQAIFEFQSMICQLTGMDISNASMYDGASSLAEAVLMARRSTKRNKVVLARSIHPHYAETVESYLLKDKVISRAGWNSEGTLDLAALDGLVSAETACVVVQSPNFLGCVENIKAVAEIAHAKGALLIASTGDITSLGLLKPPGECGADIFAAEGQPLGIPVSFGGPYLGILAAREKFARTMPGRIIGESVDSEGRRAFTLTLSTREQHIRREKATSNICSNEGLCALMAYTCP